MTVGRTKKIILIAVITVVLLIAGLMGFVYMQLDEPVNRGVFIYRDTLFAESTA